MFEPPAGAMPIAEVIDEIERLNQEIARFWSKSRGWAPAAAADLLGKSRLDWQVSLSACLRFWIRKPTPAPRADKPLPPWMREAENTKPANGLTPGELILAWANLGSLIEGTIKTLLCVWYEAYKVDIENLKKADAYHRKRQEVLDPDGLTLEPLRKYCKTQGLLGADGDKLVELVQNRRNAIQAFQDKTIGDELEFQNAVRRYLILLRGVDDRLPYPGAGDLDYDRD